MMRMLIPNTIDEFIDLLSSEESLRLAQEFCLRDSIYALPKCEEYKQFKCKVLNELPSAEFVAIVGSGNWQFSLNPDKLFAEYNAKSDIDVAVVSQTLFQSTWNEIRKFHRDCWYTLDYDSKYKLNRYGQNVYSGFICPAWLPRRNHNMVYNFKTMLNRLSGSEFKYREVKMIYFKDLIEMFDYYRRGFENAKRRIAK